MSFDFHLGEGMITMDEDPGEETVQLASDFVRDRMDLILRRRQVVRAWGFARLRRRDEYREGFMYSFQDFRAVPEEFAIPFDHDGKKWAAADSYCVNPGCTCNSVLLQFFATWKGGKVLNPEFATSIDLKTGSVGAPEGKTLREESLGIVTTFQESLGDWCGELSLRRDLLKRVARKRLWMTGLAAQRALTGERHADRLPEESWKAPRPPSPPALQSSRSPGRNDPCPCGSGKKYKKCCGR